MREHVRPSLRQLTTEELADVREAVEGGSLVREARLAPAAVEFARDRRRSSVSVLLLVVFGVTPFAALWGVFEFRTPFLSNWGDALGMFLPIAIPMSARLWLRAAISVSQHRALADGIPAEEVPSGATVGQRSVAAVLALVTAVLAGRLLLAGINRWLPRAGVEDVAVWVPWGLATAVSAALAAFLYRGLLHRT